MSLYDDLDTGKTRATDKVAGWSAGIKLLQSQLALKKAAVTQPKREQYRKAQQTLAPVINLNSRKSTGNENIFGSPAANSDPFGTFATPLGTLIKPPAKVKKNGFPPEFSWGIDDEYDPLYPNDYDKVAKEFRLMRERESEKEREKKDEERRRKREMTKETDPYTRHGAATPSRAVSASGELSLQNIGSGLAGVAAGYGDYDDEEEAEPIKKPARVGVAIAPPSSLLEPNTSSDSVPAKPSGASLSTLTDLSLGTSSVAAKIMAKYGFKEGQGLGKQEQGMSTALQVEKISKRGGRIIHENEMMPPPSFVPEVIKPAPEVVEAKPEPSITEIMKKPSKVVLLKNMVGPGEVDGELEPEVKDECNTKYGDVNKVVIFERPGVIPEEAVRIFVEFKRIESAIKAKTNIDAKKTAQSCMLNFFGNPTVVDLNGRFFGGRQVKASFYDLDKFLAYKLVD